ncbi:polysaccharide biosynthesis/export family protein [Sphingomonas sp. PAMC 26605]|uniref:polysaccharide biosynthesis/export family protein n=1 Tax=Sphingomonas sp. PAMC 26605 TaxID=1112214 RepID=UPI0002F8F668|nr:polysaccharide biosynthesis/export family protein [Sphingomonas sp. PAMC 26605]
MTNYATIRIVDVSDAVARQVNSSLRDKFFAESLGDGYPAGSLIGRGDVLDIAIWEAPPAALFGSVGGESRLNSSSSTARGTTLPEQMVSSEGRINIPFVGSVVAAGRTSTQIEREIANRLAGKAHLPQVIVRTVRNASSNVTVVGDVATSARVPVTAKGERLLDVLAAVGGVRQAIGKMTIQVTRGEKIASMPLGAVIRDPRQNIRLQPDDVVTALFQPFSFTALGATGRNEEVAFEGTGLTLAQGLARVAGLQDQRADVKGIFIFRFEDPSALDPATRAGAQLTPDGKVAVIYRVNLKDPATFFVAQTFPIRDKDVLYVSNAPLADVQKFVSVIASTLYPIASLSNVAP